jgi:hypothetical protein
MLKRRSDFGLLTKHSKTNITMAQITTYFTSSSGGGISGSGAAGEVAFFTAATVLDSDSNLAWDDTNRRLSLNGPNTVGSTLVIAGDGYTDATSAIDVRTSLTYGDIPLFKVYDNGRIDSQVLSGTGSGARRNVAIGVDAGSGITTGEDNTLFGHNAGAALASGAYNTFVGRGAGRSVTTASRNTIIGNDAGAAIVSIASGNVLVGDQAGVAITSGTSNNCLGRESLRGLTTGEGSIGIGYLSGAYRGASPSTTAVNPTASIYIGGAARSGSSSTNVSNEIVIGQGALGAGDNTTTIGNSSCVSCFISGNVVPELGMTIPDGTNITFDDATGTKIGTDPAEKFAFWNATPNVQPTTGITGAAYQHNGGGSVGVDDTFGGYTLAKVVAALQRVGILA